MRRETFASGSQSRFTRFANAGSRLAGRPAAFCAALGVVLAWLVSGPMFGFSDTWQLIINTGTTIVTFLMVFLIQNTQYRDAAAIQIKLDELIRSIDGAHLALLDLEELDESDLAKLRARYGDLARQAREDLRRGGEDTRVRELGERKRPRRRNGRSS